MRCLDDGMRGLKHKRERGFRVELDIQTLVASRGRDFPLARIAERLLCRRCGLRVYKMGDAEARRLRQETR